MTRFNRSAADVVKQTLVGVTVGEYVIAIIGVLLAHAVGTSGIISIVTSSARLLGTLVIVASTVKINDWNLYSASLGIVNFGETVFGIRLPRGLVTFSVGILGSALAALDGFTGFLILLGVAFPPPAGILISEYFFVRRWRRDLEASGADLPRTCPTWEPTTLVVWAASVGDRSVRPLGRTLRECAGRRLRAVFRGRQPGARPQWGRSHPQRRWENTLVPRGGGVRRLAQGRGTAVNHRR